MSSIAGYLLLDAASEPVLPVDPDPIITVLPAVPYVSVVLAPDGISYVTTTGAPVGGPMVPEALLGIPEEV